MEESRVLTASAIISFSRGLEEGTATFYEELAERFEEQADTFKGFVKDSKRNKTTVVRTYQETITDALEACYSFEGLNLEQYKVDTRLPEGIGLAEALKKALVLEEKAIEFYLEVAERSKALLATIPGAFRRVAKKRGRHRAELESMLEAAS